MISKQILPTPNTLPIPTQRPPSFTCISCKVKFDSGDSQRTHFKSEWHKYNLKRKVCNLAAIDLQSFQAIQAAVPEKKEVVTKEKLIPQSRLEPTSSNGKDNDDDDSEWEDVDDEEDEEDEEEIAEMLARVIKPDTCLFCAKKSTDLKKNLTHMNRYHGFFIPEEQYVIDMDGLLEYLGYKVGAGATCLWCNKEFKSLHGARLHMIYKDHCKIYFNQEKAVEEFKDFYDYTSQAIFDMKPLEQLVLAKRKTARKLPMQGKNLISPVGMSTNSKQLAIRRCPGFVIESKFIKSSRNFCSRRAKTLLKIGEANNQAKRGRIRPQNPI